MNKFDTNAFAEGLIVNKFDTNAFAEGLIINFQQLNRAFSKIRYDAKLATIKWRKVLHYGKNNKDRREGKPTYRSRAHIKALRNRKRWCMKYAKKCQRPRV